MNYATMIFSPTGGTEKVAAALTADWGTAARRVDLTDAGTDFAAVEFRGDEAVVIAVPSYGGRVPALAAERIARVQGHGAPAVLVCAYGHRAYEDTLVELEDLAKAAGFRVAAAVAALAEHSIARRIAAGRPDAGDRAELAGFGGIIRERLEKGGAAAAIPGNRPYKQRGGGGMVPATGEECVQCGQCAGQCPAGAIDPEDAGRVDAARCISCMRCVAICPQQAKTLPPAQVAGVEAMLSKFCAERKHGELY